MHHMSQMEMDGGSDRRRVEVNSHGGGALLRTRGSVLVIVMVTLLFTAFALIAFMEKASNDLLVEQRASQNRRLRIEAYSALETTLAVLEEFRTAGNGLHNPAEGWSDPLGFATYIPADDRTVEITFDDESGKISLPRASAVNLTNLFLNWGIVQTEAEDLADSLMGWMKPNHVYASAIVPDYGQGALPFEAPGRPLRSFHELAAIDKVREKFYDAEGRPNEYWRRFVAAVSLYDFPRPNINGARPDTLAALGLLDETQQANVTDYLKGSGNFMAQGPGFFRDVAQAQQIAGPSGDLGIFSTMISALSLNVTVREGGAEFRLATLIAPPNGATAVQTTATSQRTQASATGSQTAKQQSNRPNASQARAPAAAAAGQSANSRNLRYPFTLLEMRENAETSQQAPSATTLSAN